MHPTAMARKRTSKPMDWIAKNVDLYGDILHFGEGRAYDDTELLTKYGDTYIYEPHPAYDSTYHIGTNYTKLDKRELPDIHFDYIIAIYVLNILEPKDRWAALKYLREHGDIVLVAVRTDRINGTRYLDGVKTSTGTFQKSYTKLDCENLGKVLTFTSSFAIVEL